MKTVYILMCLWSDFETHNDILGVYESKELAEKAKEKYSSIASLDEDDELVIDEVVLNHFIWEKENNDD